MEIKQPAAHLDQLIRQTRAHHVQLSLMADRKASMMLTVASLLVPLSMGYLNDPRFRPAALIMIGFCVLTVVLSAYAAMPKMRSGFGAPATDPSDNIQFNLLFFGSFAALAYDEFEHRMEAVMNDHNQAYERQVREIYIMGCYLEKRKYRYVRLAYISFMCGAVTSSLAYLVGLYR
jgi:hypothetical protein